MSEIPVIAVVGATASGKTELALKICETFGGEVVGADSMQIYKYMDIGTAKPTAEERARARHHMIDIIDPRESCSAADYAAEAHEVIRDIHSRGKIPVIAGGTGLYVNAVVNDMDFGETKTDTALREELQKTAAEKGNEYMLEMLRGVDPVSANRLHPNNLKRVLRAIEFYRLTGKPISEHQAETKNIKSRYKPLMLSVRFDRTELYERINRRVDIMLEQGLVDEVKWLIEYGCTREMTSMQGIGYKEVMDYLAGDFTLSETAERIKQASRRYAKRQLTWFGRDGRINYLPSEDPSQTAQKLIEDFLIIPSHQ